MADILLYPRTLFVAHHPLIAGNKLASLLAQKTVPVSSLLPGLNIGQTAVPDLVNAIESLSLTLDVLQATYFEVNVLKSLEQYEWLLLDRPGSKLLAAPIRGYAHQPDVNHTIQHFITVGSPSISIPYSSINSILMHKLTKAKNLAELPAAAAELINAHRPGSLRRTRVRAEKIIKLLPPHLPPSMPITQRPSIASLSVAAAVSSPTAPIKLLETYHATSLLVQDFLDDNLTNLTEQFDGLADLEYSGVWQDGRLATIRAHRLIGGNGHGGWKVCVDLQLPD